MSTWEIRQERTRRVELHRSREPRVTIVVPARNEARNLEVVLPELPAVHEVILVDGSSVDGSIETARRVMPGIKVVRQTRRGKGNALACGFAAATGDIIVMFDADGSADPTEIKSFVAALVAGADFAKGTRFVDGGGSDDITAFRKLGNFFLNTTTNILFGTKYTDLCYGYNAFWRDIVGVIDLRDTSIPDTDGRIQWGDGFEVETIINCRVAAAGLSISEVPSVERLRIFGHSNLNAVRDGFRVLRTIMTERRRAGRTRATAASLAAKAPASALVAVPELESRRKGPVLRPARRLEVVDLRDRKRMANATDSEVSGETA